MKRIIMLSFWKENNIILKFSTSLKHLENILFITSTENHFRKASGTTYLLLRSPSKDRSTTTWTNRGGGRVSKTSSLVHLLPTLTNGGIKMSMLVLSRKEGVKFGSNFVYVVVEWPPKAWIL